MIRDPFEGLSRLRCIAAMGKLCTGAIHESMHECIIIWIISHL